MKRCVRSIVKDVKLQRLQCAYFSTYCKVEHSTLTGTEI